MPYHIGNKDSHDCKGYPVVLDTTGEAVGCHTTLEEAKKHLAALYANVEDAKEKSMTANNMAYAYSEILKYDKNDDGTLVVYGKATDDSVDIDQQICDSAWLDRAMPEWFKSGGNIREQHSNIAAGVAQEYEQKRDGHYISALVVDPVSVKKVENRVLKGFSIGIKSPRVVRDQKAANGRIIDGQIVEVSLVDRPANPNCQLVLAKSVGGESTLVKSEDLIEKHGDHDQADHNPHGGGGETKETDEKISAHAESARDLKMDLENNPQDDPTRDSARKDVEKAREHIETASRSADPKEAKQALSKARTALDRAVGKLEDQNYHTDAERANDLSRSITQTMVALGKSDKSAAITKHGDHDQSDHNPHIGGGDPASSKEAVDKNSDKLEKEYASYVKSGPDRMDVAETSSMKEDAYNHIDDAQEYLDRAESADKDSDRDRYMADAAESLNNAADILYDSPTEGMRQVGENFKQMSQKIEGSIGKDKSATARKGSKMKQIKTIVRAAKALTGDKVKFDQASYETARRALADLIVVEGQELGEGHDERGSLRALFTAVEALLAWREGEEWEGEVPGAEEVMEEVKATAGDDKIREENEGEVCEKCGKAADDCECTDKELVAEDGEAADDGDAVKSAEEDAPADAEVKEEAPAEDAAEDKEFVAEESDMSKALLADPKFLAVVETAVKSAIGKVETEVTELKSALEAAENKATELESELATAKSLAIGGGPKRSAIATGTIEINEWSVKGNEMLQKAAATPDTLLADGYRDLAKQYFAKSVNPN